MKNRRTPGPTLSLFKNDPRIPINGVGRLPAALTINSITEYPVFRYAAGGGMVDATDWRPWGYGENLDIQVVGVAPTLNNGSPYLGSLDDSVKFNASDYYQAGNNAFADITTEDFVVEVVVRKTATVGTIADKRVWGAEEGWTVNAYATALGIPIEDSLNVYASVNTDTLTNGVWYHGICFLDRSGSGQWYVDGVASGAAAVLSAVGSITSAIPFTIGARNNGNLPGNNNIAYLAMWKRSAWLDTHLQATVALNRFNLLTGIHPHQARGTATPTVQTRASVAHLDKFDAEGNRKLYQVGSGALRLCERQDNNGKKIKGYLSEVQVTNLQVRSEELDDATWNKVRCSITNTSTTTLPNGDTSVNDVIHEDATAANSHFIKTTNSFVASTTYVWSAWFKAINRDWIYVYLADAAGGHWCYFDLSTKTAGANNNLTDKGIEDWGNGWYRYWISFTHTETANKSCYIFIAEGNSDTTFDGLDQDSVYCWGLQVEAGVDYPTSYMPTAASAVIREEDSLRYQGDDGNLGGVGSNKQGEISCKVLLPDVDNTAAKRLLSLSDNGTSADRVFVYAGTTDSLVFLTRATGGVNGSIFGAVDLFDNAVHTVAGSWKTNCGQIWTDGASEGTDVACDIADDLDRIDIGCDTVWNQLNGLLSNIEFYERVLKEIL